MGTCAHLDALPWPSCCTVTERLLQECLDYRDAVAASLQQVGAYRFGPAGQRVARGNISMLPYICNLFIISFND